MFGQLLLGILFVAVCFVLFVGPFFSAIRTGSFLRDKVVLITGGSRGLGLEIARQVCEQAGKAAILARDPDELARAKADLAGCGSEALTLQCDLLDAAQIQSAVESTLGRFGKIDILINNAGAIEVGPLEHMKIEDFDRAMRLHFWAPFISIMQIIPHMRAAGGGRIVNISSIGGKIALPHLAPYSASKFALTGFSDAIRAELARDKIFVTTVTPGMMRTGSQIHARFKGDHSAEYEWFDAAGRLPFVSISAQRAARKILAATRRGRSALIMPWPARFLIALNGLLPGLTGCIMKMANRCLPPATNRSGDDARPGAALR
ncbi:MAG: SDR family NAD(P)-dependent oxidoreductase [Chthoniobacterales bacterium]